MRVLIVEDELLLAKHLQNLLVQINPVVIIAGVTNSVSQTVKWLAENPSPDLILMDIELADGQSFDIFQFTEVTAPIIFTTAYDEYAVRAFKHNSIDYLLKPIKETELRQALIKYENSVQAVLAKTNIDEILAAVKYIEQQNSYRSRFLIKQGQKMLSIDVAEIAYIFSENGFSFIRTLHNQKFIVEYSLDELEKTLSPKLFFRANRSCMVTAACVIGIHSWFNQKLKVDIKPGATEPIVISRDKANAFKTWMGE